jgi:hypothetical protein
MYGTHITHCCARHGCKYGNSDCPVVKGASQKFMCEECDWELGEGGGLDDAYAANALYDLAYKRGQDNILESGIEWA